MQRAGPSRRGGLRLPGRDVDDPDTLQPLPARNRGASQFDRSAGTDAGGDWKADGDLRIVAVAGRPHGEPIRQQGPFVL
jgi:hypothetical protein